MKIERDEGVESKHRNASVQENLARFELMLQGLKEPVVEKVHNKEEEKKVAGGHGR